MFGGKFTRSTSLCDYNCHKNQWLNTPAIDCYLEATSNWIRLLATQPNWYKQLFHTENETSLINARRSGDLLSQNRNIPKFCVSILNRKNFLGAQKKLFNSSLLIYLLNSLRGAESFSRWIAPDKAPKGCTFWFAFLFEFFIGEAVKIIFVVKES